MNGDRDDFGERYTSTDSMTFALAEVAQVRAFFEERQAEMRRAEHLAAASSPGK